MAEPPRQVPIEELKARAEAGDVQAMFDVGYRYYAYNKFESMAANNGAAYGAALEWYRKAAARGHGRALYALGSMHEKGKGTPQNFVQALNYYKKAEDKRYESSTAIARMEVAIAADPALGAAASVSAAAASASASAAAAPSASANATTAAPTEEQRAAEKARKRQLAFEQEAARLEQVNARLQRDRAALDADKARHEQQVVRDRTALEADRARLQSERDAFDAVRREQEAQQQSKAAAAAAFIQAKQEAAVAKQAEILDERHAKGSNYAPTRTAVAAAWVPTKVKLSECPVHTRPLASGQSVLLNECLHALCRDCAPHMLQRDNYVSCPVCQAVSRVDPDALPSHPFIEAELAAGVVHDCVTCRNDPDEEGLEATDECKTCNPNKLLCQHHAGLHRARQPTHTVTTLPHGGAALRCRTHNEPIAAYCTGCRELICLACTLSTHQSHPARLLTDTAFVESVRRRLVDGVAVARTVAEALIDHAADATVAVTELDGRDAEIQAEVNRTINVLTGLLERRREAAHESRLVRSREERAALQTTRDESEHHWRIITSAADLAEQLAAGTHLGVNATAVMVQLEAAATARLNVVIGLAPERGVPAPSILRFKFDESIGAQLAELGEVVQDAP